MAASRASTSWSVTLFLWCHFMLFSANATPLPLTVWAMIAVGLSASNGSDVKRAREARRRRGRPPRGRRSRTLRHLSANGSRSCTSLGAAVGLVLVVIDDRGEVREPVLAGAHRRFPHRAFVALAVAEDHEHARVGLRDPQVQGHAEADAAGRGRGAGAGLDARHLVRVRVAAEDAVGGAELVEFRLGEEALSASSAYSARQPCPLLRMQRSRPVHFGFCGSNRSTSS